MDVARFTGDRGALQALFELADDSPTQLAAYRDAGEVLVARDRDVLVGHLQLVATDQPDVIELKSMAVVPARQGTGIGRALVTAAIATVRAHGARRLVVSTATAGIGQLRFYQRQGFRLTHIVPDVFVPANGYPPDLVEDGIPVRDQVWLALELAPTPPP